MEGILISIPFKKKAALEIDNVCTFIDIPITALATFTDKIYINKYKLISRMLS